MDQMLRIAGMTLLCALPLLAGAETISSRGEALASSCFACHGPMGRSPGTIPEIEADEVAEELMEFRSGEKQATVMGRIATGYTDEEIRQMQDWFNQVRRQGGER